jgi:hypothetical protein
MHFLKELIVFVPALIILHLTSLSMADSPVEPIYFYATQPGEETLDQGEGGGNPFASAFVELLHHDTLTFDTFRNILIDRTLQKSWGLQQPEISSQVDLETWQFLPESSSERHIALVLVFSDYTISGAESLPGAKKDLDRISKALSKSGFAVQPAIDPDQSELDNILKEFSERSKASDIAVLYTTGHGVEVDGAVFLLPGDYPLIYGKSTLNERAIRLSRIGGAAHARKSNLVFYGGCRTNPFDE